MVKTLKCSASQLMASDWGMRKDSVLFKGLATGSLTRPQGVEGAAQIQLLGVEGVVMRSGCGQGALYEIPK